MHTAWRLATTCSVLAVMLQVSAILIRVEPAPASPKIAQTFSFRTESDQALTEWALAFFQRARLLLPPMTSAVHDNKQPCEEHFGYYRFGDTPRIDICGFNWDRSITAAKKTILHELAHAWAAANLTEQNVERFLRFRGLDTWGDDQTPWEEQGSEQAAEIIAWALTDKELVMVTMNNADPATLARAYRVLTSTPPPAWGRTPVTVNEPASAGDERLVDWAVGRFREAGLVLPKVEVAVDPSGHACEEASGRFTETEDGMHVAICTGQEGLTLTNRVAILHELGHAWLSRSVSQRLQTAFLELRGLETWNDRDQPWHQRGAEHAADIIAWALMDRDVWMYRIRPNDPSSLLAGYQLLTGRQPLGRSDRDER